MPPRGCLPNPCPMGAVDSRVTRSVGVGRAFTTRVLPGLQKPPPGKDLAGGPTSSPLLFVVLVLASFCSSLASALPWFYLPCRARCGGARGSDCPCTVIGVQKVYPSFCTLTPAKDHHLLKWVSDLECLHKDLHATTGMSPESSPHGASGLKGGFA